MSYHIYKLEFLAPVHFGDTTQGIGLEKIMLTCFADTFFSAFFNEAVYIDGQDEARKWFDRAEKGEFLLSDLLPWSKEELYLPKPVLSSERHEGSSEDDNEEIQKEGIKARKEVRKIEFIALQQFGKYLSHLIRRKFSVSDFKMPSMAEKIMETKVSLKNNDEKNNLWSCAAYQFKKECGLYFVTCFADEKVRREFENVINSLQYSGIGGKRSAGYGRFRFKREECPKMLLTMLTGEKNDHYMTLSTFSPTLDEMQNIARSSVDKSYILVRREGFVASPDYSVMPQKRKKINMFAKGSCFSAKYYGKVHDLKGAQGNHPVYRYGKAMMVGFDL